MKIKNKYLSSLKFRKVLNDLKRRPADAAKDLNISEQKINNILNGKEDLDMALIIKQYLFGQLIIQIYFQ